MLGTIPGVGDTAVKKRKEETRLCSRDADSSVAGRQTKPVGKLLANHNCCYGRNDGNELGQVHRQRVKGKPYQRTLIRGVIRLP